MHYSNETLQNDPREMRVIMRGSIGVLGLLAAGTALAADPRAFGSDQNGHCDNAGVINSCGYVDIDVDHLSHSIYGVMCYVP